MHPSDPIVWWSPHLIFSEPDWISEPPGKDVLAGMFWMPVRDVLAGHRRPAVRHRRPAGHGHKYTSEYVDGWDAVMQPEGVSPDELATIRSAVTTTE